MPHLPTGKTLNVSTVVALFSIALNGALHVWHRQWEIISCDCSYTSDYSEPQNDFRQFYKDQKLLWQHCKWFCMTAAIYHIHFIANFCSEHALELESQLENSSECVWLVWYAMRTCQHCQFIPFVCVCWEGILHAYAVESHDLIAWPYRSGLSAWQFWDGIVVQIRNLRTKILLSPLHITSPALNIQTVPLPYNMSLLSMHLK